MFVDIISLQAEGLGNIPGPSAITSSNNFKITYFFFVMPPLIICQ